MKITYSDGSFQLTWDRCRAWFNADGTLNDAEYKRWNNGTLYVTPVQARHVKVRAWLEAQGRQEVKSQLHATDVEVAKAQEENRKRKKEYTVEGIKVGQMVKCPPDRGEYGYDAIVESIGLEVSRNIFGTMFVWVTVRRACGSSHSWPSHRLGATVVEKELTV